MLVTDEPFAFIVYTSSSPVPIVYEKNAIFVPSGDHEGEYSNSACDVTADDTRAIGVHRVDVPVAGSIRAEGDPVAVGRVRRVLVVGGIVR